jgi:hypothetical protein
VQALARARSDERHDVVAAVQHPGDRGLRDRRPLRLGDLAQGVDEAKVALAVLAGEARRVRAEVGGGQLAVGREVPADEAAAQDAVGGDPDPELAAGRQDLGLDAARDQRVLDLQVADRVRRRRAADRVRADLRQADVAHVAGLHELGDRADRLLDRHVGVQARGAVDVDVVDAEAGQRVGQRGLDRRWAGVVAQPRHVRPPLGAELHAEQVVVARPVADGLGDEQLVMPHAVEVAGVEQVDPGVERGVDRGDALGAVGGAVHARHAHAAQAEGRDLRPGRAEPSRRDGGHGSRVASYTPGIGVCHPSRSGRDPPRARHSLYMSGVLLLSASGTADGIVVHRRRLRDRLAARWLTGTLDRELARGAAPDAHAALALRAQTLIGPSARGSLALHVQSVLHRARRGRASLSSRLPMRVDDVLDAAEPLSALAGRLLAPEPVSARGVAQVRVLLTDGTGPLYSSEADETLRDAVSRALDELDAEP